MLNWSDGVYLIDLSLSFIFSLHQNGTAAVCLMYLSFHAKLEVVAVDAAVPRCGYCCCCSVAAALLLLLSLRCVSAVPEVFFSRNYSCSYLLRILLSLLLLSCCCCVVFAAPTAACPPAISGALSAQLPLQLQHAPKKVFVAFPFCCIRVF